MESDVAPAVGKRIDWSLWGRRAAAVVTVCFHTACASVTTVRNGNPVALPSGGPETPCETAGWLELTPSRSFSSDTSQVGGGFGYTVYQTVGREETGYSLYHRGQPDPLDLREWLPKLGEPAVTDLHAARIGDVLDRRRTGSIMLWTGLGIALGGAVGIGASVPTVIEEEDFTLMAIFGGVTAAGLIIEIIGLLIRPNSYETTFANIRSQTLVDGEDDMNAVRRGVDRYNQSVRQQCGGGAN